MRVVLLALFALSLAFYASANVIKIGVLAPLSGSLSQYGLDMVNAVEMAAEDVNKMCAGRGVTFELVVKDTAGDPDQALQKVKELYNVTRLIVGPLTDEELFRIRPFANVNHTLIISPTSVDDELALANWTYRTCWRYDYWSIKCNETTMPDWIYRISPNATMQARAIVDLLHYLGVRRVAMVYSSNRWGWSLASAIEAEARRRGIAVLASTNYWPDTYRVLDPDIFMHEAPAVSSFLHSALGVSSPDSAIVFLTSENGSKFLMRQA